MILLVKYTVIKILERQEQFNYHLDLVVYDDSIGMTIEDECGTHTFLIDAFTNYITIFHSINSSQ